MNGIDV